MEAWISFMNKTYLSLALILLSYALASPSFPLLDNRGILHEYRDKSAYSEIIKPTHNQKLTLYCGSHYQWEILRIQWKRSGLASIEHREEMDYFRWTYIVNKDKKQ